jgi:hypothetical protein
LWKNHMPCSPDKQSYLDSYDVETVIAKQNNPDASEHDIRVLVARNFRPKYKYLKESTLKDVSGVENQDGQFVFADGRMFYPSYGEHGTFADEFHIRQKILSEIRHDASLYSETDYQTTLLIQQAFREGATVVTTAFARDGNDNRDVMEYVFDKQTGRGVIKTHNTAPDGHFHTYETIKKIAGKISPELREVNVSDRVFIRTDVPLKPADVKRMVAVEKPAAVEKELSGFNNWKDKFVRQTIHRQDIQQTKMIRETPLMGQSKETGANLLKPKRNGTERTNVRPVHERMDFISSRPEFRQSEKISVKQVKELWRKQRETKRLLQQAIAVKNVPAALFAFSELAKPPVVLEKQSAVSRKERRRRKRISKTRIHELVQMEPTFQMQTKSEKRHRKRHHQEFQPKYRTKEMRTAAGERKLQRLSRRRVRTVRSESRSKSLRERKLAIIINRRTEQMSPYR